MSRKKYGREQTLQATSRKDIQLAHSTNLCQALEGCPGGDDALFSFNAMKREAGSTVLPSRAQSRKLSAIR